LYVHHSIHDEREFTGYRLTKKNNNFLCVQDLEHTTAKLRASLACDDLVDEKLDAERKKFIDYVRQTRGQQA